MGREVVCILDEQTQRPVPLKKRSQIVPVNSQHRGLVGKLYSQGMHYKQLDSSIAGEHTADGPVV